MKAILFDIGGTILDDSEAARELLSVQRRSLAEHGCATSDQAFGDAARFLLATFVPSFRRALAWYFTKPDIDRCSAVMRDTDAAIPSVLAKYPRKLHPGIQEVLAELSRDYTLALAGNAPTSIRHDLERLKVLQYFTHRTVSQDIGISKPDPRFFPHLLNEAGVSAPQALMIGDRLDNDIIPARALGMKGLWVRQGEYAILEPRVPKEIPDAEVTDVTQIPAAVATICAASKGGAKL